MFGLWRIGGGDRNLGEIGHLGDSRKCSMEVGDLTGCAPAFELGSGTEGSRIGVLREESVFAEVGGNGGLLFCCGCPAPREGLRSCWLFFRDRVVPALIDEACELVLCSGLVGEGSRDCSGDGAAEDAAEVADVWEVNFDGHESVLGVMVAVLAVDSRDSVGWRLPTDEERLASSEGSMSAVAASAGVSGGMEALEFNHPHATRRNWCQGRS